MRWSKRKVLARAVEVFTGSPKVIVSRHDASSLPAFSLKESWAELWFRQIGSLLRTKGLLRDGFHSGQGPARWVSSRSTCGGRLVETDGLNSCVSPSSPSASSVAAAAADVFLPHKQTQVSHFSQFSLCHSGKDRFAQEKQTIKGEVNESLWSHLAVVITHHFQKTPTDLGQSLIHCLQSVTSWCLLPSGPEGSSWQTCPDTQSSWSLEMSPSSRGGLVMAASLRIHRTFPSKPGYAALFKPRHAQQSASEVRDVFKCLRPAGPAWDTRGRHWLVVSRAVFLCWRRLSHATAPRERTDLRGISSSSLDVAPRAGAHVPQTRSMRVLAWLCSNGTKSDGVLTLPPSVFWGQISQ